MNLNEKTATELIKLLNSKACSAVEVITDVFSRIKKVEPEIEAFITLTEESAQKQAKEVDEKRARGEELGPLAGVPVAIKDVICTKGVKTTAASKILKDFVPTYDATVVKALQSAGAVFVGKTNLDEFAMGSSCETSYFKQTKNPCNTEYVPGGSSGGSAAAVAAHETVLALGTDTGGSVRLPAHFCGIAALRPTYGRVSRFGVIPMCSSFDQVGPMGKTVRDLELLFDVVKGADPKDATSFEHEDEKNAKFDIKSLKIGVPKEFFGEIIDPDVREQTLKFVEALKHSGAQVIEVSIPHIDYLLPTYYTISTIEVASNLARYSGTQFGFRSQTFKNLEEMYENTREEGLGAEAKRRIILGTFLSSAASGEDFLGRAIEAKRELAQAYSEVFEVCDLLVTPTSTTPAFKLGEVTDPEKMHATDLPTVGPSILAIPALTLPCGFAPNGLPVGAQLIGKRCEEQLLFEVGKFYEENCR